MNGPLAVNPVSLLNSRLAQASRLSDSTTPFGIDQAPTSVAFQYGPPGWASSSSIPCLPPPFRRKARIPALMLARCGMALAATDTSKNDAAFAAWYRTSQSGISVRQFVAAGILLGEAKRPTTKA